MNEEGVDLIIRVSSDLIERLQKIANLSETSVEDVVKVAIALQFVEVS